MAYVRLTGQLICTTQAERATVLAQLPDHIRLTRAEPGCLQFDVMQTSDPLIWQVDECFASAADFAAHQLRTKTSDWFNATQNIRRDFQFIGPKLTPDAKN